MRRITLFALLVTLAPALGAQAPSGFRTFQDPKTGLTFHYPTDYTQIPLPPTEQALAAKYIRTRQEPSLIQARIRQKPEVTIFAFPIGQESETAAAGEDPGSTPKEEEGPRTIREAMELSGRVRTFNEFREKRLGPWKTNPLEGKEGFFDLELKKGAGEGSPLGFLFFKEESGWILGAYAITYEPAIRPLRTLIGRIGKSLMIDASAVSDAAARKYRYKDLPAEELRIRVRQDLAKGWKAQDTDRYILVNHSRNGRLVGKIARDVEAMRDLYQELFPPGQQLDAVSVIRICRNQEEYHLYGGPRGTGGYWHPGNEELVFYDYKQTTIEANDQDRRRTTDRDSLLVLYHEAFHQYIYYAVGEVTPHDWFNEGHGDFFSGALIPTYGTKVAKIEPSPWRFFRAKAQHETRKGWVPLENLLRAERKEYYDPKRIGDYYSAGWAFVYFMRSSETIKENPAWAGMLDRYFDTLKSVYQQQVDLKGPDPSLAEKQDAGRVGREKALNAMLEGVDLPTLELAWTDYIKGLRNPWPGRTR